MKSKGCWWMQSIHSTCSISLYS